MKSKSLATLHEIEEYIKEKSYKLSIFKGYTAVNKRGVEKLIDDIYANLPADVMEARKYLKSVNADALNPQTSKKTSDIYNALKEFEIELDKAVIFTKFAILNIRKIENLLDRIYSEVPDEITRAENFDND